MGTQFCKSLHFTAACGQQGGAQSGRKAAPNSTKLHVPGTFSNGVSLSTAKGRCRRFGSKDHLLFVLTRALVLVFHYHARYWLHLILAVFNLLNLLLDTRHKATNSS